MMNKKACISAVIVNYNRRVETEACINSVIDDTNILEILVVDNNSKDNSYFFLKKKFNFNKKMKIIKSIKNLGAAGGRNLGASEAKGRFLLFIDSDNIVSKDMSKFLLSTFDKKNVIMTGPVSLYFGQQKIIWCLDAYISRFTSISRYNFNKVKYSSLSKNKVYDTDHILNCFMVEKKKFNSIKGFDERYFIMFEEADFAARLKKKFNGNIKISLRAKTFHHVPFKNTDLIDTGNRGAIRSYLVSRNRFLYILKNSNLFQRYIFVLFIYPSIILIYSLIFIKNLKFNYLRLTLKGFWHGLTLNFKNDFVN
jgi:GT2 family glycosyltransferase